MPLAMIAACDPERWGLALGERVEDDAFLEYLIELQTEYGVSNFF